MKRAVSRIICFFFTWPNILVSLHTIQIFSHQKSGKNEFTGLDPEIKSSLIVLKLLLESLQSPQLFKSQLFF